MDNLLSVDEQEKRMAAHLGESNCRDYLFFFSLYHCTNPNTHSTSFFKAAALLFYLAEGNTIEFNKLIQTVSMEEISSEFIALVLDINDSILRFDVVSLKKLSESCNPKLKSLVLKIFDKQISLFENKIKEPIGSHSLICDLHDSVTIIRDCAFVVENYTEN